jgi:hypothetical protein
LRPFFQHDDALEVAFSPFKLFDHVVMVLVGMIVFAHNLTSWPDDLRIHPIPLGRIGKRASLRLARIFTRI